MFRRRGSLFSVTRVPCTRGLSNSLGNMNKGYNKIKDRPRNKGMFVSLDDDPMKAVTLRLPESIIRQIEQEAKKKGITRTEFFREIISERFGT